MDVDRRHHGHPGAQRIRLKLPGIIKDDLHRHPLNDFHVVARGVFRGQEAESGAAAALKAVDVGRKLQIGVAIDGHDNGLARPHFGQLRFLEIGDYPHVRVDQCQQRLTDLNECPGLDALAQ